MNREAVRKYYNDNKKKAKQIVTCMAICGFMGIPTLVNISQRSELKLQNEQLQELKMLNKGLTEDIKNQDMELENLDSKIKEKEEEAKILEDKINELEEFNKTLQRENLDLKDNVEFYKTKSEYLENKQNILDGEVKKN